MRAFGIVLSFTLLLHAGAVLADSKHDFPGRGSQRSWNQASAVMNHGLDLSEAGKKQQAIVEYNRALKIYPFDSAIYYNLGNAQRDVAKFDEAEQSFKKAIELEPGYRKAWYNLGRLYVRVNKLDLAEKSLQKALLLDPNSASTLFNLAAVFEQQGRFLEAQKRYSEAKRFASAEENRILDESLKRIAPKVKTAQDKP